MEYNTKREQLIKELRVNQDTLDNLARVSANARHAQSSSSESGTKGQLERELGKTTQFEKDFSIEQSNTLNNNNNNNNNAAAVREGQNEEGKDEQIQQGQEQQEQEQKGEEQGQQEQENGETIAIIGELEEEEDELDIEEEELDMDDDDIDLDVDMNYDMDDDREL